LFLPIPGSLLDGRGREEEDAARVNFRLHGDVISEPHPTPPGPVYTTERCIFVVETGRKREISLSAAAARVDGPAVHAKPQECTHA